MASCHWGWDTNQYQSWRWLHGHRITSSYEALFTIHLHSIQGNPSKQTPLKFGNLESGSHSWTESQDDISVQGDQTNWPRGHAPYSNAWWCSVWNMPSTGNSIFATKRGPGGVQGGGAPPPGKVRNLSLSRRVFSIHSALQPVTSCPEIMILNTS